jgi:hypothetical protein
MRSGSFAIGLVALVAAACSSSSSAPVGPAACEGGACGEDAESPPPNDSGPPVVPEGGGTPVADAGEPPGADAGADAGSPLMPAFLNNCLVSPLSTLPDGQTSCTVLLIGVHAGCAQPGLSPATPQEVAALLAYIGVPDDDGSVLGNACELAQLAPSASAGSDCSSAASGWCDVPTRGCTTYSTGPCTQAICTTAAFDAVANYTSTGWTGYTNAFFDCP